MTEKKILSIVETLNEFQTILLGQGKEVFNDHKNITYERIESAPQRVQRWKSLIQEFGVALIYIKWEANLFFDDFSHISMVHHAHKLVDTNMEEETCELLCLDLKYKFLITQTVSTST